MYRNAGATLIELMITLILSLLLMSILSTLYVTSKHQGKIQSALNTAHTNTFLALHILVNEIKTAGYIGCPRLTADFPLSNSTRYTLTVDNKLEVETSGDSDAITIRHRSVETDTLQAPMVNNSVLSISDDMRISEGDILLISDCRRADIFQVQHIIPIRAGLRNIFTVFPLQARYEKYAEIGHLEINTYFTKSTGHSGRNGQPVYELYKKDIKNLPLAWVEGIQLLKVEITREEPLSGISVSLKYRKAPFSETAYGFFIN